MRMKKNLLQLPGIAGIVAALGISSCAYDPYYSTFSGSHQTGFGHAQAYRSSNVSTSLFVSTGDARWGYDPNNYCYYDHRSRRYYDPHLCGYYPVGYRPPVVVGVPHPHGWRPGRKYCPPPKVVRNVTVVNYRDRASAYRVSDHGWAQNVRVKDDSRGSDGYRGHEYLRSSRDGHRQDFRPSGTWDRNWLNPASRRDDGRGRQAQFSPGREARLPSSHPSPVTRREAVQPRNFTVPAQHQPLEYGTRMPQPPAQIREPNRRPEAAPARQFSPRSESGFRGRGKIQLQSRPEPSLGNPQDRRRGLRSLGDA